MSGSDQLQAVWKTYIITISVQIRQTAYKRTCSKTCFGDILLLDTSIVLSWNYLVVLVRGYMKEQNVLSSTIYECHQPLFKICTIGTQYEIMLYVDIYEYIPFVYGVWHLFNQFLFLLQLTGHVLHVLLVVFISILEELVANPKRTLSGWIRYNKK